MSEEIHSASYLTSNLVDLAVSPQMNRAAIAGTRSVKFIELSSGFKEVAGETITLSAGPAIDNIGWTDDGQVRASGGLAGPWRNPAPSPGQPCCSRTNSQPVCPRPRLCRRSLRFQPAAEIS